MMTMMSVLTTEQQDPNPFTATYLDDAQPHPGKKLETEHQLGWERKDVI